MDMPAFLPDTIEMVLAQEFRDFELPAADDDRSDEHDEK